MTKMKIDEALSQGDALTREEIKEIPVNTMMESGEGSGSGSGSENGSEPEFGGTQIYSGQEDCTYPLSNLLTAHIRVWWSEGSISGNPIYATVNAYCSKVTWDLPIYHCDKPVISAVTWSGLYQISGDISYSFTRIKEDIYGHVVLDDDGNPVLETYHRALRFSVPLSNVIEKPQDPNIGSY